MCIKPHLSVHCIQQKMSSSNDLNVSEYLKNLYCNFSTNSTSDQAIAVSLPIILLILLVFLVLLIKLFRRKKDLKAKLNKTPDGSPPSSDSEVSIAKADIIPRPSSVV